MLILILKLLYYTFDHLLAKAQVAAISSWIGPQYARHYRSRLPESQALMEKAARELFVRFSR